MAANGWGWGSLFGGNAKATKDTTKNAILGLRGTLDMLSKRERHLQNQMDEQDAVARKNVSSNKGGKCGHASEMEAGGR
jgi:charged multivesicular body protein 4